MVKEEPLVSIVAISYNQERFVLESLNSFLQQDYKNIEIILCDDCSIDETPNLIRSWLTQHSDRFHRTHFLTSDVNLGVCGNLARGMACATGIWIKPIACDDILCKDAISRFVEYTQETGCELIFSQMTLFQKKDASIYTFGDYLANDKICLLKDNPKIFLRTILRSNFLPAPGVFYSRRLLEKSGGIDTSFKHLDDWPLWLRMLPLVDMVGWIEKPLILYRISEKSVSQKRKSAPIGSILYADRQRFYREFQRLQLNMLSSWHMYLHMMRQRIVFEIFGNSWLAYLFFLPLQFLSPLTWFGIIKRAFHFFGIR